MPAPEAPHLCNSLLCSVYHLSIQIHAREHTKKRIVILQLFLLSIVQINLHCMSILIFEIFNLYDFGLGFISSLPPIYLHCKSILIFEISDLYILIVL
jgi:hypothetical protein